MNLGLLVALIALVIIAVVLALVLLTSHSSSGPAGGSASGGSAASGSASDAVINDAVTTLRVTPEIARQALRNLPARHPGVTSKQISAALKGGGVDADKTLLKVTDDVRPNDPMTAPWPQACSAITAIYDATSNTDFVRLVNAHAESLRKDLPLGATVPRSEDTPEITREKSAISVMDHAAMALPVALIHSDPVGGDVEATATLMMEQTVACPSAVTSG